MSRLFRVVLPGRPHHVTQRGVRSMRVFDEGNDHWLYMAKLHEHCLRSGVDVLAYCLMPDHVHLVVVPETKTALAEAISQTHWHYSSFINARARKKGYLFQSGFNFCPLDDTHYWAAVRYAEQNPVRAGLVRNAWEYPWSSAPFHCGLRLNDAVLRKRVYEPHRWRKFLAEQPTVHQKLRKNVRTGYPCGDERFIEEVRQISGRSFGAGRTTEFTGGHGENVID